MPTSLTYIILSTRGYEPWRPAADMGTNTSGFSAWPSPGFSWSIRKLPTSPELRRSSLSFPYLATTAFQGARQLIQKRKLFREILIASPGSFGLPRRAVALNESPHLRDIDPASWFRNMNRIPFRTQWEAFLFLFFSSSRKPGRYIRS